MQRHHETDDATEQQEPFYTSADGDGEDSELDEIDPDDPRWDAFIADDDERDPQPDYGDFWPAG
jgi:hypothetical protein